MPFVRNPRDRNKQIENQQNQNNALSKDLGTVGSVGGSLLQDTRTGGTTSAPTLSTPSPERKTAPSRATNLGDLAAANLGKTQQLSQNLASQKASEVRDYNRRLGQAQTELRSSLERAPDAQSREAVADEFLQKVKEGKASARDYTNLRNIFGEDAGPGTLSEIDAGVVREGGRLAQEGKDIQAGGSGTLEDRFASQGTYTTGGRSLDTALLGQQSDRLQQTGRAAANIGDQSAAIDDNIRATAEQRQTDLAALPGVIRDKTGSAFDREQGFIKAREEDLLDKMKTKDFKYGEEIQVVDKQIQDYDKQITDLDWPLEVARGERFNFEADRVTHYYDDNGNRITDRQGLEDRRQLEIRRRDKQISDLKQQQRLLKAERAELLKNKDTVAKQAALDNYLPNFSDEDLARLGTSRQVITEYVMDNDLAPQEVVQLLQHMELTEMQATPDERAQIKALQYLSNLAEGYIPDEATTTPDKESE